MANPRYERRMHDLSNNWHLDKKIPILLIFTIIIQTASIIWWASAMERRVISLELSDSKNQPFAERITKLEERVTSTQTSVARVEDSSSRSFDRIEKKLDNLLDKRR